MDNFTPQTLTRAIARHPRASLQDALLIFILMLAALLLALQYNLFFFIDDLSEAQRQITLAEAIFLTVLMSACLFAFIIRRLRDQRDDAALKATAETELRQLTQLALQDSLTSLLNRRALMEALVAAVKAPPTDGSDHALFLMDLNGFKRVNDVHGHQCGDQVLEVVAERFRSAARPSDLVARIGGDEFAVLAYNVNRGSARKVGTRFVRSLESPIRAGTHIHEISMAVGVALIPENGATAGDVFRNADKAMYRAKAAGESLVFFEPDMAEQKRIA